MICTDWPRAAVYNKWNIVDQKKKCGYVCSSFLVAALMFVATPLCCSAWHMFSQKNVISTRHQRYVLLLLLLQSLIYYYTTILLLLLRLLLLLLSSCEQILAGQRADDVAARTIFRSARVERNVRASIAVGADWLFGGRGLWTRKGNKKGPSRPWLVTRMRTYPTLPCRAA